MQPFHNVKFSPVSIYYINSYINFPKLCLINWLIFQTTFVKFFHLKENIRAEVYVKDIIQKDFQC